VHEFRIIAPESIERLQGTLSMGATPLVARTPPVPERTKAKKTVRTPASG
jgi:hypothetical protein